MSNWKVIITDGLNPKGQAILSVDADVHDYSGCSAEELLEMVSDCDALIVRGRTKVTADLLKAAPKLKVVGRAGVGVDNIDLAAAQSLGVTTLTRTSVMFAPSYRLE